MRIHTHVIGVLAWSTAALIPSPGLSFVAPQALSAVGPVADKVVIDLNKPLQTIYPNEALGAALDGVGRGGVKLYLTPFNIEKMRSAGLRRVTYRTRAELGIEVWHWSEEGTWSEGVHRQGYWTSSDNPAHEPPVTWGYFLPRRGDSVDEANDLGYSRIDDGDPTTFWKSNPYLDRRYTGAAESRAQWMVVSFKANKQIDAMRILWGTPFARHFQVQYWRGRDEFDQSGHWTNFPHGEWTISGSPDDAPLRLADTPIAARFLRILLLHSSNTAPRGSTDIRDRLGYAVREIAIGVASADGGIDDAVHHGTSRDDQTLIQVSSTDPWHRAIDRDLEMEQPSLDMVFRSKLNGGLPMMVPIDVLYDTPDNAVAEVRYLKRRRFPVDQIELGEEPDGQFIAPEDFADLYLATARAVHVIDPKLAIGGPSMQVATTSTWPDLDNGPSWTGRFVARLKERGGMDQLQFFSFEHYAFSDVCHPLGGMLRDESDLMDNLMTMTAAAGVPKSIPWIVTEYGLSPFAGRAMSEVAGALYDADVVGQFLSLGGSAAFMYGYAPDEPINEVFPCAGYGNMMLFEADDSGRSRWAMPSYYAHRMLMRDWGNPADLPHRLYAARSQIGDAKGRPMVAAYPLLGQDRRWTVLLINRNEQRDYQVSLVFRRGRGGDLAFGAGQPLKIVQYSSAEYVWQVQGEQSHPVKDLPPERFTIAGTRAVPLPAFSLTVVSGLGPSLLKK